jgi:hypothetical protein
MFHHMTSTSDQRNSNSVLQSLLKYAQYCSHVKLFYFLVLAFLYFAFWLSRHLTVFKTVTAAVTVEAAWSSKYRFRFISYGITYGYFVLVFIIHDYIPEKQEPRFRYCTDTVTGRMRARSPWHCTDLLWVPHLSCNCSWCIHQRSLTVTDRYT